MSIAKTEFSNYIKAFKFRELFNEMGWNNDRTRQSIVVVDAYFNLVGIAEKSGFRIFICKPAPGNQLPDKSTRKKIENKLTKLFQEHLIIFIDEFKREQVWQLAVRKAGSPTKISETRCSISQDPELLYQRASGLFFTLDEEEKVTIIDVTKRVAENFQKNNERVTKKFYGRFEKELSAFLGFIKGIDDQLSMDWYASLMLNRLMFCYFIQKKGFLDNNKNYLQDKLKACKEKKGKNKFYSFYRDFLLALFHKGLGAPEQSRRGNTGISLEIGRIPYLNGGLFDEHEIETTYEQITIDDKAFKKLFDFFDEYEWHLDTRETASGKDINPDVIGYIFEKYINDRAQMGAYYTKEDITDYISKNCIIPWLFDEVKRHYPKAFIGDGWLWQMVKASGDEYIYDAVKYGVPENCGVFDDLPAEIRKGFEPELEKKVVDGNGPWLWGLRKDWNKPGPSDIALPTELYREVIERRKRYADIKSKITTGEIKEINDFITYNLNIRQFAQDVIETTDDAKFIRHFYNALSGITILDPTCGSGAFLFAAMNILEPLYEACILRMKNFIDESCKGKHKFFEDTLAKVNASEHPNLQYFIFKSIILNNLYGVDIMNEAVEIAKLRLFLKLVATVDTDYRKPNLGLEPLPDVDFNIRAGNTLVGYATKKQIVTIAGLFVTEAQKKKILEQCDIAARAFARYKEIQLSCGDDYDGFKKAKDDLNDRLKKLTDDLDCILYMEQYKGFSLEGKEYRTWLATHQPFHWFAEFYEIIVGKGGFDVVIGNPPYVEYSDNKFDYKLRGYMTLSKGNLFGYCIERSIVLSNKNSNISMIVPISLVNMPTYETLKILITQNNSYFSNYSGDTHPGTIFQGVQHNLTIFTKTSKSDNKNYTTHFQRFYNEAREYLFVNLKYVTNNLKFKISQQIGLEIIEKISSQKQLDYKLLNNATTHYIYMKTTSGSHYKLFFKEVPFFSVNNVRQKSSSFKPLYFNSDIDADYLLACLNSNLFNYWWCSLSDGRNVTKREVGSFPCVMNSDISKNRLQKLSKELMIDLLNNSQRVVYQKQKGTTIYDQFKPRNSKPIIDQIDCLIAQHYGFTHEELDFIINYDIKYRMGKELNSS